MKKGDTAQYKAAEDIKSLNALKKYLCTMATGGLERPQNKRVEAACAACKSQCAYGEAWLERFWAEEDRKWEREQHEKKKEADAAKLEQLKSEYEAMCRERRMCEQGDVKPTSFLYVAMKPMIKR